jgi:hypothetical protein
MASARSAWRAALLGLALSSAWPAPARACTTFATHEPSLAEKRRNARLTIARASAIIDGEVVRPYAGAGQPALVRALSVLKGPRQAYFEVGERHSCDVALMQPGERMRMVLFGGPDLYYAPSWALGDRYIDQQLRWDRRRSAAAASPPAE